MEVINHTKEVPHYVVSVDGGYTRYLSASPTEEEIQNAKQAVLDYEKSAQSVIFQRLMQRGVISEIKSYRRQHDTDPELTDEQKLHNEAVSLLDAVLDDGCCRAEYYLFTPKSEDDIKDLGIYHKLQFQYNDIYIADTNKDELSRYVYKCEVGKTYIYEANHECEFDSLINPEALIKSVTKMCDVFEKLGKAQRKAN
jgi:predicted transcriptional regulator